MSLPTTPGEGRPITLTTNPRLDAALVAGWAVWEEAATAAGVSVVATWLAQRQDDLSLRDDLEELLRSLLGTADLDDRNLARVELAELLESDAMVADTLWEGVLSYGRDTGDADTFAEAVTRLAAIAEAHGDPLAAAEYHLEFLNWRRQPGHSSDPELVQTSFDEVIRLARLDGEQTAAAHFEYRQAGFTRLAEREDERAMEGDWEGNSALYASWA